MKLRGLFVAAALLVGCAGAQPAPTAPGSATLSNSGSTSADLDARVRRIEERLAKLAEALDFLGRVYDQQKAQEAAQQREQHDPNARFAVAIDDNLKAGMVNGPAAAPVTIVMAFDFACPYCERVHGVMDELVTESKGDVRVVYKNLVVHPEVATDAHLASCAAAKQGKYTAFTHEVFEKGFKAYASARDPAKLAEANLLKIAKDMGLDTGKLKKDMHSDACKALVASDMTELEKFNVNSTPTFFINGHHIGGALDKGSFKALIDEELKVAQSSGIPGADYYAKVVIGNGEKAFRSKADATGN
ncbi:MAG: DsbA family protein [Kofleriaceae bacterium]